MMMLLEQKNSGLNSPNFSKQADLVAQQPRKKKTQRGSRGNQRRGGRRNSTRKPSEFGVAAPIGGNLLQKPDSIGPAARSCHDSKAGQFLQKPSGAWSTLDPERDASASQAQMINPEAMPEVASEVLKLPPPSQDSSKVATRQTSQPARPVTQPQEDEASHDEETKSEPKTEAEDALQPSDKYRGVHSRPAYPSTPFQEKHMFESLDVASFDEAQPVLFYNMLNQGPKRGKETKILALDCERILTKKGDRLARVSIVNFYGNVVFDTLIKPWAKVVDYREWITGIKQSDLKHAPSYPKVAPILKKILNNKVVVGHSLKEDFEHLKLNEDEYDCEIRDISEIHFFKRKKGAAASLPDSEPLVPLCSQSDCSSPSTCRHATPRYNPFNTSEKRKLKELAGEFLNAKIQTGHHSSIIDARIALALYRSFQLFIEEQQSVAASPCQATYPPMQTRKDIQQSRAGSSSESSRAEHFPFDFLNMSPIGPAPHQQEPTLPFLFLKQQDYQNKGAKAQQQQQQPGLLASGGSGSPLIDLGFDHGSPGDFVPPSSDPFTGSRCGFAYGGLASVGKQSKVVHTGVVLPNFTGASRF